MTDTDVQKVHYYVLDTLSDWEAAYALAVLHTPISTPLRRFQVVTVAERDEPITTMAGLVVVPDITLDHLSPAESALLVLPGAPSWETGNDPALQKATDFVRHGTPVAAICGATYGLARTGLLDERKHTSNAPEYIAASGYRGKSNYVAERAVIDRNVITAGATGALELARQIFLALGYYPPRLIEAWYQLYRTGDPRYYVELTQAAQPQ